MTDRQLIILQTIIEQVIDKSEPKENQTGYSLKKPLDLPMELAEYRELDTIIYHALNGSLGKEDDATLNLLDYSSIFLLVQQVKEKSRLNSQKRCFEQFAPLALRFNIHEIEELRHIKNHLDDLLANISHLAPEPVK